MLTIGKVSAERQLVIDISYECLMRSIAILKPGIPISMIGDVMESYATSKECSVVNQFIGHRLEIEFHEGPQNRHHRNRMGILIVPGMTFTIESMINAGLRGAVIDPVDH